MTLTDGKKKEKCVVIIIIFFLRIKLIENEYIRVYSCTYNVSVGRFI